MLKPQTITAPKLVATGNIARQRITSIDFLRGLVMVIMALDHVRDYFHGDAMTDDPTNLATTTPFLFFTRWITHFCAPTFVFLAGISAFLSSERRTKKDLSIFLLTRGLWLVFAEVIIVTFGWTFNPFFGTIILQVIWAIGMSMILLSGLIWLPFPLLLVVGLAIVFGHNLLDSAEAASKGNLPVLWNILHRNAFVPLPDNHGLLFYYAFPVWTGVMVLGYCFGKLYGKGVDVLYRRRILIALGLTAIISFIIIRFINLYGDPSPWSFQKSTSLTIISFLNVSKYPPSLMYVLMTLGPSILFLAFFERVQNRVASFFITFGRVPFFYYILHLFLIHTLCMIAFFLSGYGIGDIGSQPFYFRPQNFGYNLLAVYGVWAGVVLLLYPLCRWYEKYKASHNHWLFSYI